MSEKKIETKFQEWSRRKKGKSKSFSSAASSKPRIPPRVIFHHSLSLPSSSSSSSSSSTSVFQMEQPTLCEYQAYFLPQNQIFRLVEHAMPLKPEETPTRK